MEHVLFTQGRAACLSDLPQYIEGQNSQVSQAEWACWNYVRDLGLHPDYFCLGWKAGLLGETRSTSLWLLGSLGSMPGHAVLIMKGTGS